MTIPLTAIRFKDVVFCSFESRNRPIANPIIVNPKIAAAIRVSRSAVRASFGIAASEIESVTQSGRKLARMSTVVSFSNVNESRSSSEENGENTAQPIAKETAMYGKMMISIIGSIAIGWCRRAKDATGSDD